MNDVDLAYRPPPPPYNSNEGSEWFKDRRALNIKFNKWVAVFAIVELVVILAQGLAISGMLPLQQLIPLVLAINADGSYQLIRDIRELPANKQQELIAGSAQNWVQCREEYWMEGAPDCYKRVSIMSDKKVLDEYQEWFAGEEGPQARLWDRGHIEVEIITDGVEVMNSEIPQVVVPFWRTEKLYASKDKPQPSHWTATIAYRLINQLKRGEYAFNPAGLRVIARRIHCDSNCGDKS